MKFLIVKTLIALLSLFGVVSLGNVKEQEKKPLYFAPPNILQHFSLGYRDFVANLLWLRFIQDADFCSFEKGKPIYKGDVKSCEWSWSFHIVNALSELAPRFKTPYTFSTIMLSIFAGDQKGAEYILQKGLKHFPKDWKINFQAVYFYSMEMKKPEMAAYYAYQSAENGGPHWLYGLAAKKYGEAEQLLLGEAVLKNLLNRKGLTNQQKSHVQQYLKEFQAQYKKNEVPKQQNNKTSKIIKTK